VRANWWWIDRWRKSTAFTDMSLEEQGAYRNLCDEVVIRPNGVIPEASLARASGDAVAWPRIRDRVLAWMEAVPGGWTNKTALEVKGKSQELSRKQRDRAKSGWKKRKVGNAAASATADAAAMHGKDAAALPPSPSPSPSMDTKERKNDLVGLKPDDPLIEGAREVWQHWRLKTNHRQAVWTPKRSKLLVARLREEPGTVEEKVAGLMVAVDGALLDPWFNGEETGRTYLELDNIFRNRDRVEKLQQSAREPPRRRTGDPRASRVDARVDGLMQKAADASGRELPRGEDP
jgi:hypothetical protein